MMSFLRQLGVTLTLVCLLLLITVCYFALSNGTFTQANAGGLLHTQNRHIKNPAQKSTGPHEQKVIWTYKRDR